jgi:hypothetical protein
MSPLEEYGARFARFRAEEKLEERQFIRIGNLRLATAVTAVVLAWLIFGKHAFSQWWLLVPLAAFLALVVWHQRVLRARTRAQRAAAHYDRALARLRDQWIGRGNTGERFRNASHVYAEDLDVFGKGSLFELIATTRTAAGEDTLADWLLRPAEPSHALERQRAIEELSPRVDLREDVALLAEDVPSEVKVEPLAAWGAAPVVVFPRWLRPAMVVLAACGLTALVSLFAGVLPLWLLALLLAADLALIYTFRARTRSVLESVECTGRDLRIFAALAERLEAESFSAPLLQRLHKAFTEGGRPASKRIAHLGRLLDWLDSGDHVFIRILRPLVFWNEQLSISFEKWRAESGAHIGEWLRAAAELEALSSFAALRYERPDWTMPQLLENTAAIFSAEGLRHPLIPAAECVPNDLELNVQRPMLVVSGSNMSGKSTLLRAVGLNAVLAWAGAPVPAARLTISPLQVGASIRINDSLQDHRSRFFAEITRIRHIVDLAKSGRPVLFLLDELLSGTNSHDRRVGAAGIVRGLLRANCIGLITTHDLALASIAEDVGTGISNVHFEDQMNGSEMRFDYKLRPGVVQHSNALALMRAVGLEV